MTGQAGAGEGAGEVEPPDFFHAFLSHAEADKHKALAICEHLESRGLRCWIAPRDLRPGEEYGEEILVGIRESRCLVLVLSAAANASPMVRREVERAVSTDTPVIPIRVEEVLPRRSLEFFVSASHWIDAWHGPLADHASLLAEHIKDDHRIVEVTSTMRGRQRQRSLVRRVSFGGVAFGMIAVATVAIALGVGRSEDKGGGTDRSDAVDEAAIAAAPAPASVIAIGTVQEREIREYVRNLLADGSRRAYASTPSPSRRKLTREDELPEVTATGFRLIEHFSVCDLREWRQLKDVELTSHDLDVGSHVVTTLRQVVQRVGPGGKYSILTHTSGTDVFVRSLNDVAIEVVASPKTMDKYGRAVKRRVIEMDLSDLDMGERRTIELQKTFWNAFQSPRQWWAGVNVTSSVAKVDLLVLFPANKPFKSYTLLADDFAGEAVEITDRRFVIEGPDRTWLWWVIEDPRRERSYRVGWEW